MNLLLWRITGGILGGLAKLIMPTNTVILLGLLLLHGGA
jgi:hypothetical protein